MAKAEFRKTI